MQFFTSKLNLLTRTNPSPNKESLCVQLDRKLPVYTVGEAITGRVIVTYSEPTRCESLTVQFKGKGNVYWVEERMRRTNKHTHLRVHSSEECYFNQTITLHPTQRSERMLSTDCGTFNFPFTYKLPANIPSTFDSETGHVRYEITARLKKFQTRSEVVSTVPFKVDGILDLRRQPECFEKIAVEKEKSFNIFFQRDATIKVRVDFPRTRFVRGEIISFKAEVNNKSTRKVKKVEAELVQTVSYFANSGTRQDTQVLARVSGPMVVRPGEIEIWNQSALRIPECTPSRLTGGCKIIDVQYEVKIRFGQPSNWLNIQQPITIGTNAPRENLGRLIPNNRERMSLQSLPTSSLEAEGDLQFQRSVPFKLDIMSRPDYPFLSPMDSTSGRTRSASFSRYHSDANNASRSSFSEKSQNPDTDIPPPSYREVMQSDLWRRRQSFFTSETVGSKSVQEIGANNFAPDFTMLREKKSNTAYAPYEYGTL